MPRSGKKLLVDILLLQLTEQQKSTHNAGLYSHHEISSKTSALPKMKGQYFRLETSCIPCVFASPPQTSAIILFLQKNSCGAFISSLTEWSNTLPPWFFFCSRELLRPQEQRDLKEYISLTQLHCPPFVKVSLAGCTSSIDLFARISAFVLDPLPTQPYLWLNICIPGLLQPLSGMAFPQLLLST